MRTAKTPAFSRSWPVIAAQSPAAKISGSVSLCRVSLTRMKPLASSAIPVSASHGAPPAWVTQTISSASSPSPDCVCRRPASTRLTSALQWTVTPRSARTPAKARRTLALCVGRISPSAEKRWKRSSSGSRPRAVSSLRRRYCMASVSSTPPAPAPTTAMVVVPAWQRTRSNSASQRSLKRRIGFTGTTCSAAPGTPPSCGVEPMLIDSAS
jgi:hypothetical protein